MFNKLLKANQYGLLITSSDGHYYIDYEIDYELSPTDESKEFLSKLSEKGIVLHRKQYGDLEEVLYRLEKIYKFLRL